MATRIARYVFCLSLMSAAGAVWAGPHGWHDPHFADNGPRHQPQPPPHSQPAPPPHRWGHGDIHRFPQHDWYYWHHGYWHHGWYGPRFGWWWVVPGYWYYYPAPIYPYPNPYVPPGYAVPPPTGDAPPATQYWYYCAASKAYYPYVSECPAGWQQVLPTPPDLNKEQEKKD